MCDGVICLERFWCVACFVPLCLRDRITCPLFILTAMVFPVSRFTVCVVFISPLVAALSLSWFREVLAFF